MKRYDFSSSEEFENKIQKLPEEEAVMVILENGWYRADMLTNCKNWKTALKRFFQKLPEETLNGWQECITETAETADIYSMYSIGDYAYSVESVDENKWYIFLNVRI